MQDRWRSVDEIADYLGVSKDTVYAWVIQKGRRACPDTRSGGFGSSSSKTSMTGFEPAGRRKRIDIAIFEPGAAHDPEHLRRIVICEKEPNTGRKSASRIRSPEEAEKEFALLKGAMTEAPDCRYGLWTNGLELFFFDKEATRFDVKFKSIGDWPLADESIGTRMVASTARMRRAEPEMLRVAFRHSHNFIHGNEGMAKDAAFWQFLYLIFCKMVDERRANGSTRFWAGPTEQFDDAGRRTIKKRILALLEDVKERYGAIFKGNEEITLSDRALSFIVSELAKYDLSKKWEKQDGVMVQAAPKSKTDTGYQTAVAPDVLFIQRAVDWLKPGGRMGIVLPDGILGNPGDEYIRSWILRHCWVLASVDLPVETFIVEANVNILTSLLFLKKKTQDEIKTEDLGKQVDYPVFMAVAEKVGFDRRGAPLYMRTPDGEEILEDHEETERIRIAGTMVKRTLKRKKKIVDDDLPRIADAYRAFRTENPEPGA